MGLLTTGDKLNFRAAIKLVTDTFMVTPVIYKIGGESTDRFNEDRLDKTYTDHNLSGLVEYPKTESEVKAEGKLNVNDVDVTFNMEDLIAAGLVDATTKMVVFNQTKDRMLINGDLYNVCAVSYDGPLDQQNILVLVGGKRIPNNS